MVHSKILLNDGTSAVLLNDGTSYALLNEAGPAHEAAGSSGGFAFRRRLRNLYQQLQPPLRKKIEETKFSTTIIARPVNISMFATAIVGLPVLNQFFRNIIDIFAKPVKFANEDVIDIKINPVKHTKQHVTDITTQPKRVKDTHVANIKFTPFKITRQQIAKVRIRVMSADYFSTKLTGKVLHGIDIIKKAMEMSKNESFKFRESVKEWRGAAEKQRTLTFDKSSSVVGEVVYETDLNILEVELNGQIYQYCNVPRSIYEGFRDAGSKGRWYNKHLKGRYQCP